MKECFEFADGSYYEFDRWDKKDLPTENIRDIAGWIVNLVSEKSLVSSAIEFAVEVLIHPNDLEAFADRFETAMDEEREYKASKYKTRRRNREVIGVGLTRCTRLDSEKPTEFGCGIYLPLKFSYSLANELFVDVSTITNKVIYEPSLLTPYAKKILATKTR